MGNLMAHQEAGVTFPYHPEQDVNFSLPPKMPLVVHLTKRFHVAMQLFSNKSQMMSKRGKNKKVAHKAMSECVTDVLTTF